MQQYTQILTNSKKTNTNTHTGTKNTQQLITNTQAQAKHN